MKKITTLFSALLISTFSWQANAQLIEDFEGSFPNTGWVLTSGSTNIIQSSAIPDHTSGSGQFAMYDCYNTNGSTAAYLETPSLVVTSLDKTFSFWSNYYFISGSWGQSASLSVDVSSNNGVSWTIGTTNYILGNEGGGWLQTSIDLSNFEGQDFTGNNVIVRFVTVSDYGSYDIGIDDVNGPAVFVPACPEPNTLSATVTAITANLSWIEAGSATSWEVEYDTVSFTQGTGNTSITSTNPYNLTGLTANTSYDFYVRAICGTADTSTWAGPFNFTTPCVAYSLPWAENFDAGTSTPSCWTQSLSNGEPWIFATSGGHVGNAGVIGGSTASGNNFAYVDDSTPDNTGTTLQSPFIDISSLTVPMLSFYLISNNEGFTNVDFSVDVWDGAAWNTGVYTNNSNTLNGEWEEISVVLSSLTITGPVQLRFIVDEPGTGSFYDDVAIDDVTFVEAPACPTPSNLLTSTSATSANLSWTENGTATSWEIEYDTANFTQGIGNTIITSSNPYNLIGLTANTSYDFYVRAICGSGDTSAWSSPFNFSTPCATYTPNYLEDFATFVPSCWDQASDGSPNTGATGTGTSEWNHTSYLNAGSTNDAVKINLWNTGTNDWLLSPTFDLSAGNWELAINAGVTTYNGTAPINMGSDDTVQVLLSIDGGLSWSVIHSWDVNNQPTNTGDLTTIDLTAYTGTNNQFAIWATEGTIDDPEDFDFHINDFEIRIPPSCTAPTALITSNLLATSVDLSWTSTATSWEIEYDTTGFTQGTGTAVVTGANPYSLTGLTATTSYDFYVRAICGAADTSSWVGPINFVTPCIAPIISTFPYSENFDSEIAPAIPCGWTTANDNGDANEWISSTVIPNSGANSLYLNYNATEASNDWIFTPELQLSSGTNYDVTFAYRARNATYPESMSVWLGSVRDSASMTTILFDSTNFVNTAYNTVTVSFTATSTGPFFVGFFGYSSSNQWAIGVDDFSIDISTITAISSLDKSIVLNVSPNPNKGLFTLNVNTTNVAELNIQVMNAQGQTVYAKNNFENIADVSEQIDLSNNAKGIYFINVTSDKGIKTHKVIVQ